MLKDINISIRKQELKDTYSLIESEFGTVRLQHVLTQQQLDLSFLDQQAAIKYCQYQNFTIN